MPELQMGSRRHGIAAVRAALAVQLVTYLGLSLTETPRTLGAFTAGNAKAFGRAGG